MIYIYHHPNIGDHIIFNGLIRLYAEQSPVTIFCLDRVKSHVDYMYRDNEHINLLSLPSEKEIDNFITTNNINVRKFGWRPLFRLLSQKDCSLSFDECFYKLADVDFRIRFEKFFVQRDDIKENEAYEQNNPNHEPYIYIHDDPKLNFNIRKDKHRNDLKIIRNDINYNIFEMRKILENATEIHTMQTGMLDFCNSIPLSCPIFVHLYVRRYPKKFLSKGINPIQTVRLC